MLKNGQKQDFFKNLPKIVIFSKKIANGKKSSFWQFLTFKRQFSGGSGSHLEPTLQVDHGQGGGRRHDQGEGEGGPLHV